MYYRNAAAAVVVYDITKSQSLDKAKAWVKELQRQANPNIVIALVGNKLDLVDADSESAEAAPAAPKATETEDADAASDASDSAEVETPAGPRQVPTAEAEAYAKECGLLFFEASAKTGQNVQDVFTEIGESLPEASTDDIAKTIPLDSIAPKPAAPAGRRSAANAAAENRVDLGEGAAKKGGCC